MEDVIQKDLSSESRVGYGGHSRVNVSSEPSLGRRLSSPGWTARVGTEENKPLGLHFSFCLLISLLGGDLFFLSSSEFGFPPAQPESTPTPMVSIPGDWA